MSRHVLTVGKMRGDGSGREQIINLPAVRIALFDEAVNPQARRGKLSIRQIDRVHAITGAPWCLISQEAAKEGL